MFKGGTGGCSSRSVSPKFPGCGGFSGVSPTIYYTQMVYHLKHYH